MKNSFRIFLPCVMLLVSGCHAFHQVQIQPGHLTEQLQAGDRVRLETKDGNKYRLAILKIEDGMIHGKRQSVKAADVVSVQRSEIDAGKSLGLGGLIAAGAGVFALILAGF